MKKQDEELYYAKEFLSTLKYEVDSLKVGPDPPDIEFVMNGKTIGLELTKIYNKDTIVEYASYNELISKVESEYAKRYPEDNFHIHIRVEKIEIKKSSITGLINEIIERIHSQIEEENQTDITFSSIKICAKNTKNFRIFSLYGADYINTIPDDLIKESVNRKEQGLTRYKRLYVECWLLIIMPDTYSPSSGYFFPDKYENSLSKIEHTTFDKVFIMGHNRIDCLK